MFFQKSIMPRPGDLNRNGALSNEAVLQILESAAGEHSASACDSLVEGSKAGITWVLTEWRVKILCRPTSDETMNITTWVRGKAPSASAFRDFIVADEHGREMVLAEAKFALFDMKTLKLTRISPELFASYKPEEKTVFESSRRLSLPDEYSSEMDIMLRRSDIDYNGHVHNTRYISLAEEALPEASASKDFTELRAVYMKPLKMNDRVTMRYSSTECGEIVSIYGNDILCCVVLFT